VDAWFLISGSNNVLKHTFVVLYNGVCYDQVAPILGALSGTYAYNYCFAITEHGHPKLADNLMSMYSVRVPVVLPEGVVPSCLTSPVCFSCPHRRSLVLSGARVPMLSKFDDSAVLAYQLDVLFCVDCTVPASLVCTGAIQSVIHSLRYTCTSCLVNRSRET